MGDRHAPRKNRIPKERKELIKQFIAQNEISSAKDIEEALKNMFKDTLQELLEAELDESLGYEKYEYSDEEKENYRNGYSKKTVHSTAGDIELSVPRDRNGEFEPAIVEKGEKDISGIEEKSILVGKIQARLFSVHRNTQRQSSQRVF